MLARFLKNIGGATPGFRSSASLNNRNFCRASSTDDVEQGEVDELINKNLVETTKDTPVQTSLLTTRREAIHLYRDIYRFAFLFDWPDAHGNIWRDTIRTSARQEFEKSRFETNPEEINRLLVSGRQSVSDALDRFLQKRVELEEEKSDPTKPPPFG
ncbi:hypothetical protein BSKO_09576 [Bryopsis sp. KO-2023]|nr:hypothetical protein BSKO_09576 [Bryopsis sp. KO-2023]